MQNRTILLGSGLLAFLAAGAASAAISGSDKQFMMMAARTDMIEAHEGEMAEQQAQQGDVKDFGKILVEDHTNDYAHISELAAKTGVKIPTGINAAKDPKIVQLMHLKGAGFDRRFTQEEVADHRQALAAFKRESEHGKDESVKAYAAQMIPVLEKHLKLAEACAKPAKKS